MLNKIKLIIFDLDGTLADTLWEIRDGINAALAAYGMSSVNYTAVKGGINNGPRKLCQAMLPEPQRSDEAFLDEFLARYNEEYGKVYMNTKKTYDGIRETVAELHRRGYRLAVLSNKQDEYVKALTASLFPDGEIEFALGSTGELKKPDPALTLSLISAVDPALTPRQCALVGDSDVDIKTAHNAGLICVGASWGYRGRELLESNHADIVIDRPEELTTVFGRLIS